MVAEWIPLLLQFHCLPRLHCCHDNTAATVTLRCCAYYYYYCYDVGPLVALAVARERAAMWRMRMGLVIVFWGLFWMKFASEVDSWAITPGECSLVMALWWSRFIIASWMYLNNTTQTPLLLPGTYKWHNSRQVTLSNLIVQSLEQASVWKVDYKYRHLYLFFTF